MERKDISALIFTLVISSVLVPESHAYCWQAGWNPGFKVGKPENLIEMGIFDILKFFFNFEISLHFS